MSIRQIQTEPCPAREGGGNHCPHYSPVQHAMMHHRDEYCCWCGASFCIDTYDAEAVAEYRKQHGPHV